MRASFTAVIALIIFAVRSLAAPSPIDAPMYKRQAAICQDRLFPNARCCKTATLEAMSSGCESFASSAILSLIFAHDVTCFFLISKILANRQAFNKFCSNIGKISQCCSIPIVSNTRYGRFGLRQVDHCG